MLFRLRQTKFTLRERSTSNTDTLRCSLLRSSLYVEIILREPPFRLRESFWRLRRHRNVYVFATYVKKCPY